MRIVLLQTAFSYNVVRCIYVDLRVFRTNSRAVASLRGWVQVNFHVDPHCWSFSFFGFFQRRESVHDHHRKKIFWRTFLASKKNFPGRWWRPKPYKNLENHIYYQNLSSVAPFFFFRQRKVLHWSRAVYAFFFPVSWGRKLLVLNS